MTDRSKPPILVVDDEPDILFSLRALLGREFEVHTAEDGIQALDELRRHPVQVIMTDQRMPRMTGVELLSRARGECPDAIRIIFTGYADLKAVVDAINQGEIYRYLTKPWDPEELRSVLHEACVQFELISERHRLLVELRDHIEAGIRLPEGARHAAWVEAANSLLARLDRALAKMPPLQR